MKYVVIEVTISDDVREMPIIFPNALVHSVVADAVIVGMQEQWKNAKYKAVSAGEISSMDVGDGSCSGGSETLKLKSRGKLDDHLIRMHDYMHGII